MLRTSLEKIDKFYFVLGGVLCVMAILVVISVRGIFSAYNSAYELDEGTLDNELKIEKDKLDEVYKWSFERPAIPLEIRN